jgi:hypothetical protein
MGDADFRHGMFSCNDIAGYFDGNYLFNNKLLHGQKKIPHGNSGTAGAGFRENSDSCASYQKKHMEFVNADYNPRRNLRWGDNSN